MCFTHICAHTFGAHSNTNEMKNKVTIRITHIPPQINAMYLDKVLYLRTARKVGDVETLNMTQWSKVKSANDCGIISIELLK